LLDSCFIADINPAIKQIIKNLLQKYRIKIPDAIIAATAIYLDMPLLTADTGFKRIPELNLILLEF
jgi:predicted nucleic acid-binding protein